MRGLRHSLLTGVLRSSRLVPETKTNDALVHTEDAIGKSSRSPRWLRTNFVRKSSPIAVAGGLRRVLFSGFSGADSAQ